MKIMPHKTTFPFNIIMEFSFGLSKVVKKKTNNQKILENYNKGPRTDEAIADFFNQGEYSLDPGHGLLNMIAHPRDTLLLAIGDCDDYAAKLYALAPYKEKYILTYFTHNLKKGHTVFVWYDAQDKTYHAINGWRHHVENSFDAILQHLYSYSESPGYDYHLASFDNHKNKGVSFYK